MSFALGAAAVAGLALGSGVEVHAQQPGEPSTSPASPSSAPAFGAPARAAARGSQTDRRLLELLEQINQLQREIRQLRSDVEVMQHGLEGVKRRQRELYLDVDRRLRDVEVGVVRSVQPAQESDRAAGATSPDAVPATETASVQDSPEAGPPVQAAAEAQIRREYQKAFDLLREGRYARAAEAFQGFLQQYPDSAYSDNAQYWLGETSYVSRDYQAAAAQFKKVLDDYPNSTKIPDATLKLGFTYYELGNWEQARAALETVLQQYPESTAARLAQTRLNRMRKEGH
ncbi:MAG: tol-pal system protein YbgF [Gammaproteobacteria bacterium]|nr:tol-pal system protein YbgF [Gammaproteobacteria bacterium]NIR97822.1 tol-pal system protein YbgF [Gammaproteobacteria bacterium]NIT63522.1 tol-pal system protein YbgF [Gammaproteobacteria bacterium]NIV20469.1 tol-pal system protein YbgF [Gammaproteobacteria bacterium]NIY32102.1 tol-pal system protein YbgF [Gammaproteobacteria bacterium]